LVVYLATAPKSNALYKAQKEASKLAKSSGSLMPPKTILNAPTKLMNSEGYGKGYIYDHDTPQGFSGQNYFPENLTTRPQFYNPVERGFERDLKKRLEYWEKIRRSNSN
jgi:putative ATPase